MRDLPPLMVKLKAFSTIFTEEDIKGILAESYSDASSEIDFETFLGVIHDTALSFLHLLILYQN